MVTIFSPMHKMAVHHLVLNMSTLPAAPLGKNIGTATSVKKNIHVGTATLSLKFV